MARPRIALFVLEALPNARAVRRLVADLRADIALVGLSNAERPSSGGLTGQIRRHLARSGTGILPYLAVNFGLQLLAFAAMRVRGPSTSGVAYAIIAGNRNVMLFLAALPAAVTEPLLLFIACYQVPMYLTPILLGRLYTAEGAKP